MNTTPRIAIIALSLLLVPLTSINGATFLPPTDETSSVRSETKGDVYVANESIVIAAPVDGDIFAAGNNIDISGSSSASIFAVGKNLSITGEVKDDVRVAGESVSLGSTITHDLFAAGSSVLVMKDSHVLGDAYVAGETITISGTIHGDVRSASNRLVIASGATVMGNITSYGNSPIIEDGATVSGTISTVAPKGNTNVASRGFALKALILSIVSSAVFALMLMYAAPVLIEKSKTHIATSPLQSGVTGILWLLLFLPASILLMLSTMGVYIGILALTATFPLLLLGFGMMVVAVGSMIYPRVAKQPGTMWHHAFVGAIVLTLVSFLDIIGFILITLAFIISLGAVLKAFWNIMQGK